LSPELYPDSCFLIPIVAISPDRVLQTAWGAWVLSWLAAALWSTRTERRASWQHERVYRLTTAAGAILLFGLHPARLDVPIWRPSGDAAWTMAFSAICGFAFTWWARITLGRLWSGNVTRKSGHFIVTTGPYALVRHPIYTGLLLAVLATAIMRGTVLTYVGAVVFGGGLFIKARLEEQFLRSELGEDDYRNYARRVPMLVPFVHRP
jgi:protein-S-isoprenylcysteine O-methyltransferase Ste14